MFESPLLWIFAECPLFLVWVVGMLLALVWWRRHPKVSMITILALCLLCLLGVVEPILNRVVSDLFPRVLPSGPYELPPPPDWPDASNSSSSHMNLIFLAMAFFRATAEACLFGLLLIAIFGWRQRQDVVPVPNDDQRFG
jgi:hypothetical protein